MRKVLYPRSGVVELEPLVVDTDGKEADGANINTCLGIGTLRTAGYNVKGLPPVVHMIEKIFSDQTDWWT